MSPIIHTSCVTLKHIRRALTVVCANIITTSSDYDGISKYRYRTETVPCYTVTGCELLDFAPVVSTTIITLKNICRASIINACSNNKDIIKNRNRIAEIVPCYTVTGCELLDFAPVVSTTIITLKNICRALAHVSADVIIACADRDGVTGYGN